MTERQLRQLAQGFGAEPTQITASIDGNVIYQGSVNTVDTVIPTLPDLNYEINNVAFTWSEPGDWTGTRQITISVTGSTLLLANTQTTRPWLADQDPPHADAATFFSGTWNSDGVSRMEDPLSSVTIDGVPMLSGAQDLPGQWWWKIPAGSTFQATLSVNNPDPNSI